MKRTSPFFSLISMGDTFMLLMRIIQSDRNIEPEFIFSQCCLMGFLGVSNEITPIKYLVMHLVPVEDQQVTDINMKIIGHEIGQCDFCVPKDCSVIKNGTWKMMVGGEQEERERGRDSTNYFFP